jgi:hypothetical protein
MARSKGDGAAKKKQPASPIKAPTKRAAREEIDDIFSSKSAAKKGKGGGDAAAAGDGGAAAAKGKGAAAPEDTKALSELADKVKEAREKRQVRRGQAQPGAQAAHGGRPRLVGGPLKPARSGVAAPHPPHAQGKRPKVEGSKDDIFGEAAAQGRKKTEEGFAIYSEEELGLGKAKGGDTDLCPFDCDCCY